MDIPFRRYGFLTVILFTLQQQLLTAQVQQVPTTQQGWTTELGVGLDFFSNLMINPVVGGGESRLGLGADVQLNATLHKGRFSWYNFLAVDYAIQKAGNGYLKDKPDKKVPFQKNMDNIWLNSRAELRTSYFSKFYYAADLFFSSQLTTTYEDNFLTDVNDTGHAVSKFLSPGITQISLGMTYKPNDFWSIFGSPVSYKNLIILDNQIANDFALTDDGDLLGSIHGNPLEMDENGDIQYQNFDNQFGAAVRVVYQNRLSNRFGMSTNLLLFSNYLKDPDHIDVNFRNQLDLTIFKGLSLSLLSLLTYDHDVLVQITDNNKPGGVSGLGRRISYSQQLLLKYTFTFGENEHVLPFVK